MSSFIYKIALYIYNYLLNIKNRSLYGYGFYLYTIID